LKYNEGLVIPMRLIGDYDYRGGKDLQFGGINVFTILPDNGNLEDINKIGLFLSPAIY
jgi:hypothetical protein